MLVDCFGPAAADRNITIDLQCEAQLRHTPTGARIDVAIEPVPQGNAIPVCNPGAGHSAHRLAAAVRAVLPGRPLAGAIQCAIKPVDRVGTGHLHNHHGPARW
ncbi:hypothetical protein D1614_23930 [Maribellus luteus]|uniref:Uncharacterized protein n=1 Tax=Maribellus luteus TaxID=2305463 RepID=A0A399SR02_9BACT|nr:hypothetical protein D1614_23930 [Maribellus luteus]